MKTIRSVLAALGAATLIAGCASSDEPWPYATPDPSPTPSSPAAPTPNEDAGAAPVSAPSPASGGSTLDAATPSTPEASTSPAPVPVPISVPEAGTGCSGSIVCDDFESYPTGSLSLPDAGTGWHVEAPNCSGTGAIAIDATESHSGTHSLKVTGTAGYCNHVFLGTNAVASLTGEIWARFYVRLTTALTNDHATFLAMHDATANKDLRMGGQNGVFMWNRESDDATLPAMSPAGTALSVVPTTAAWHCVEFALDATGPTPTLSTWVDGTLVVGMVVGGSAAVATADSQWVSNTSWAPHLIDARFGWESYAGEAETLWFDDVAIGAARIGCGP
jgi:hypothetical protein